MYSLSRQRSTVCDVDITETPLSKKQESSRKNKRRKWTIAQKNQSAKGKSDLILSCPWRMMSNPPLGHSVGSVSQFDFNIRPLKILLPINEAKESKVRRNMHRVEFLRSFKPNRNSFR